MTASTSLISSNRRKSLSVLARPPARSFAPRAALGSYHSAAPPMLGWGPLQQPAHDQSPAAAATDQSHDDAVVCAEDPRCGKSRPRRGGHEITPFHNVLLDRKSVVMG